MKILKYKLATEANHGTPENPMMETVLSDVSMPYTTETDYQMALSEAFGGHRLGGVAGFSIGRAVAGGGQNLPAGPAGCAPTGAFSRRDYLAADAGACESALICAASSADSRPAAIS